MSKSVSMSIKAEVQKKLNTHFSSVDNISMVLGVSGGADSMCLLHLLHQLGVELQIVHINYQKRAEASDNDARLVEETATDLGIDCKVLRVDADEAAGQNFQQWARDVRYNALQLKRDETGADAIALAHHRDDQLETILQKIFRGGGMASWQAMQVWDGQLFRPLLNVSRDNIEEYCLEHVVQYRNDESNFKSNFARNFLRNKWLPELEQHFPGWRKNVLRVAGQAAVFDSSLQYILEDITDDKDRLNRKQFLGLNAELQKSALVQYMSRVDGNEKISRHALNELSKLADLQTGKSLQLSEHMHLMRDREHFKLVLDSSESPTILTLEKEKLREHSVSLNGLAFGIESFNDPEFGQHLYLDAEVVKWPLQLRPWQNGDEFQPLGMEGHQNVADHLTNRKISAVDKEKALVVETFEETICAVIFPPIKKRVPPGTISEQVKYTASTRECLIIKPIK